MNHQTKTHNLNNHFRSRVIFLDNLRYLLVFGVVLQHASNSYIGLDWWPVMDATNIIAEWLNAFFDSFLMPSLFFVAGYFSIPSIRSRTLFSFLKAKFKRLGVPWLVCSLTICPILPVVYHFTRNDFVLHQSFWSIWKDLLKNAAGFYTGFLPPMDMVMQNNLFYQRYMWFVGLLMLFFVIFGCFYQARPLWFATRSRAKIDNGTAFLSDFKIILGIGFITFIGSTINIFAMFILAQEVSNPETWLSLGNMVQFRLSRIFLHFTYFLLGITAYKNHWFEQGRLTNHARAKGICLAALVVLFLVAKNQMQNGPDHLEQFYGLVFWFVLNFLCITALGFFLSLCFRYMAEPTRFNTVMAKNSYNIYLSHYIFIIIFQLALLPVGWMPSLLKFMVISVFGLLSSFAASHYLVQKRPGFTVIMLFCLVFILFLFIR